MHVKENIQACYCNQ